jgi:hypothetical protein
MKKFLFIALFSCLTGGAFAQMHKVTIYSSFVEWNCKVNYTNYNKLYPDSVTAIVMIDYMKKYQLKKSNTSILLLRMNLDGWKLVSVVGGKETAEYVMSKEILLNDAAMKLYLQNLDNLRTGNTDLLIFR